MPKAIAVQAVFLVGVIAIFLFFIAAIFWGWADTTKFTTSKASCEASRVSYCSALMNGVKPEKWDDGCGQYEINEPSLPECCSGPTKGSKCP